MKKIIGLLFLIAAGFPCALAAAGGGIATKAPYAFMTDFDTGEELLNKNADKPMAPASMSKLMTIYILLEKLKAGVFTLDDEFHVSQNAWQKGGVHTGGSTMFLAPNSRVKIGDLLKGIIVQSGNDACIVVAENLAGSEEQFVIEMNKKAAELGLTNSHFENATGWPSKNHKMSVRDIATLSRLIISNFSEYYDIFSQRYFTYNKIKQENRNPLLFMDKIKADGLKTGHTEASGYGLAASAIEDETNRRIILVVNGLKTMKERGDETKRLIEWGMREFTNAKIITKGQELGSIPVFMGQKDEVKVVALDDLLLTYPKTGKNKIGVVFNYEQPVKAPVNKGDVLGKVVVSAPDVTAREVKVVAAEDVREMGFFGRLFYRIKHIFGFGYDANAR